MKRIHNYILIAAFSVAVASCFNEELNPDKPSAESGDDVQFGLTLGDPETKTVYGDEANNAFPIYWINGDKVQIFSPQCLDGRRSAEYEVSVSAPQNFADALNKTGEYGVQWGDSEYAIFYSLYPSGAYTLSSDGTEAQGITINYSQNIVVNGNEVKSDMEDCLMYAKNDGGEDNEYKGVQRGHTVNLKYTPISTVFMVTLNVASNSVDDFTIQSVSLVAPAGTNIAGTFSLNVADGSFVKFADNKSSNTILTQLSDKTTGGFYKLEKGKEVTIPLFLAPVTGLNTDGWKIIVKANNKDYTKKLTSQDVVAGQIHKVILPSLSTNTTEWETGNWMENIPRNVYLSEVSIPGTWNSLNPDFQKDLSISSQYANGVRAFHLDTRWQREIVDISWSGIEYKYTLGVANGGSTQGGSTDKYDNDSPTFESCLDEIIGKVSNSEYMVLVCSFAQNSADISGTNGKWYAEISAICSSKDDVYDAKKLTSNTLVGDVLGKVIVIVNMPEAINTSTEFPSNSKCLFTYLPSELDASHFDSDYTDNTDKLWISETTTVNGTTTSVVTDTKITMLNNQAQVTSSLASGISTNNRGYAPTIDERTKILNHIVDWSKSNYAKDDYAHNQWIYLGLGGYKINTANNPGAVANSYLEIETTYNTWIYDIVTAMGPKEDGTTPIPYYPVGIVLMNSINGTVSTESDSRVVSYTNYANKQYGFDEVVKEILLLNNKYRLQYDPDKPADYSPALTSAAASYSSGMHDQNVADFGWD